MFCVLTELSKIPLSSFLCALSCSDCQERKKQVCGWLMQYVEEFIWSADQGRSHFLQPGKGDAQPQTSGVFRAHHFTSLRGRSTAQPQAGGSHAAQIPCISCARTAFLFLKPESLGSGHYMRPATFVVKKCSFCTRVYLFLWLEKKSPKNGEGKKKRTKKHRIY